MISGENVLVKPCSLSCGLFHNCEVIACTAMFVVYSAEEDTHDVYREVVSLAGNWAHVCLALRLLPSDKSAIETAHPGNPHDCLLAVVQVKWLQKGYNNQRFGSPTWRMLVKAVGDIAGGNYVTLAETIAKKHPGKHVHTQHTFRHSMMDSHLALSRSVGYHS